MILQPADLQSDGTSRQVRYISKQLNTSSQHIHTLLSHPVVVLKLFEIK